MWTCHWILSFSLISLAAPASVIKDFHRADSTKSKHRTLLPVDSVLLNDISEDSEEFQENNVETPDITITQLHHPVKTLPLSNDQIITSSYATGYQQKPSILASGNRNSLFISASEPFPVAVTPIHIQQNDPQFLPRTGALKVIHNSHLLLQDQSIKFHPSVSQIDRFAFGNIAEERQSRPHRRPQRPLFNPQRPRRRPFFRATTSTLFPPPRRPTPPVPNLPLINAPDISSIPLQSAGDSGTNDVLVERFPPFNDEPFPPFNDASFDQPIPQLTTQDEPLSATREVPATPTHQSPRSQTQPISQGTLQQTTPVPHSVPQLPLQQIISIPQAISQLPLQQSTPIPQVTPQLPLQQNNPLPQPLPQQPSQQSTPLPQLPTQQETSSPPRQPTPSSFQQVPQAQFPSQPPAQVANQPVTLHNSQRQPHHLLSPSTESQKIPQSLPQQGAQNQQQQISQVGFEHIPQLLPPPEPVKHFQTTKQQFPQAISRPQQQFLPPPPLRIPQQGPQRFLSPPQQRPPQPQGVGRQSQPLNLSNTRQPRFAAQTRRPRRLERQPQEIDQRRPQFRRDTAFSTVWAALQSVFEPSRSRTSSPRGRQFRF